MTNEFTTSILINQIPGLLEFFPYQFATIQGSADFLTIADLNGDENPDLVFAEPSLNAAYILLSLPSIIFEPPELSFGPEPMGVFGAAQATTVYNLDPVAGLQVRRRQGHWRKEGRLLWSPRTNARGLDRPARTHL